MSINFTEGGTPTVEIEETRRLRECNINKKVETVEKNHGIEVANLISQGYESMKMVQYGATG